MSFPHKQVHAEYSKRMKDADMLETHIIQARIQATAIEERAHTQIVEEVGEAYDKLGLPPGTLYLCYVNRGMCKQDETFYCQHFI